MPCLDCSDGSPERHHNRANTSNSTKPTKQTLKHSKHNSFHNNTTQPLLSQTMATSGQCQPPSAQGLVVLSCGHDLTNAGLITNIVNRFGGDRKEHDLEECQPKYFNNNKDIECYDLKLDNKYYSANISLFDLKDNNSVDNTFSECVNGIIIYFDGNRDSSFTSVESCLPFVSLFDNEIKLLVCESIDETNSNLQSIQKWCIDNEFELIELCPKSEETDSDQPFEEVDGMTRIMQAIQAHSWPHSQLKERPQYKPSAKFKEMIDSDVFNSINAVVNKGNIDLSDEKETDDQNDCQFDNFDDLFTKFGDLKLKASQLNDNERKVFAEKVTLAFWRAVGGDPQEIGDLDDDNSSDTNFTDSKGDN